MHQPNTEQNLQHIEDLKSLFPETWQPHITPADLVCLKRLIDSVSNHVDSQHALEITGEVIRGVIETPPPIYSYKSTKHFEVSQGMTPDELAEIYKDPTEAFEKKSWFMPRLQNNMIAQIKIRLSDELEKARAKPNDTTQGGSFASNSFPRAVSHGTLLSAVNNFTSDVTGVPKDDK